MPKQLIIAEKPSVAMDIARVLGVKGKKDGYVENDKYIISWCVGHLVNIAEPKEQNPEWDRWNLAALPMIPDGKFKLTVLPDTKKQFQILKRLMNSGDVTEVVCATDAGREGELIFRRVYALAGCKKPVKRLWISSMTDEAIRDGFRNLKPGENYLSLAYAAFARAEADWLVGMNFSRLLSIKCADKLSIGRVQTPVLAMLVQRRLEIENFKPEPYWNIEARTQGIKATWFEPPEYKTPVISSQDKARTITQKCQGQKARVIKVVQRKGNSAPPLLFDLTTLQREANSKFNMSAKQTLGIVQNLYEKHKIVTYPRTDSRYISQDIFKELTKHIAGIQELYSDLISEMKENINRGSRFKVVNDKKVSDHHAIIPTSKKPNMNALSDTEKKIYDMICRRFIAAFLPPATFLSTNLELDIAGERFRATGKVFQDLGWLKAEPWRASSDNPLPPLKEGQLVDIEEIRDIKKMTRPPAQYNDSSLLRAMETAGKSVETEEMAEAMKERGLGTPATRAAIIERLFDMGYAQRKGKSIVATDKGVQAIKIVTSLSQGLCSPEMTGEWEYKLKLIEQGKYNYKQFMEDIKKFLTEEVAKIMGAEIEYQKQEAKILGKCPACGGDIVEGKKGYGCTRWREGCKFVIWKTIAGKKITESVVKLLLRDKKSKVINGFKTKQGKSFSAALELKENEGNWKVEFSFPEQSDKKEIIGKCPLCGGDVIEGQKGYGCSKWKEGCKFVIWKKIAGSKISDRTAKELLTNGQTFKKLKFTSKAGKKFEAGLKLDKGVVKFDFD